EFIEIDRTFKWPEGCIESRGPELGDHDRSGFHLICLTGAGNDLNCKSFPAPVDPETIVVLRVTETLQRGFNLARIGMYLVDDAFVPIKKAFERGIGREEGITRFGH